MPKTRSAAVEKAANSVSAEQTVSEAQALEAAPATSRAPEPTGKIAVLLTLMRRPQGASLEELTAATGWQAHSVRGVISGAIKKKLGLQVSSTRSEAGRVYALVQEPER